MERLGFARSDTWSHILATFVYSALVDAFNASAGIVDSLIVAPRRIKLIYNNHCLCAHLAPLQNY